MKIESVGATLRTLGRSHSLLRAACFCASLLLVVEEAKAQPNYGQIVNEGLIKGMMLGLDAKTQTKTEIKTDLIKKLIKPEGTGKIETKEGNVKIDTKDPKSLELASNFRKNYKKSTQCQKPETEEINVKCANEYIRARKTALAQ